MTNAPVYDVDFYADEFIRNPWPHYAAMRALGPVVWLPRHENFALVRHAEVAAALRDHDTFISGAGVAADAAANELTRGNSAASDGDRHTAIRRATSAPLLPGALADVRPRVDDEAVSLIMRLLDADEFDAIADFARHLPFAVVRDLVGLPDLGRQNMIRWANATFDLLGVQNERGHAAIEVFLEQRGFLNEHAKPDSFATGSFARRLYDLVDNGQLDPALAPVAMRDYLNPSLDTTISATGQLLYQLGSNPDQWSLLRDRSELARGAANEAVRMASPVRSFVRHTSREVTVGGVDLPVGARVMMVFASANRDEQVFDRPNTFDITRDPRHHLGFGSGIHMCVGQHLAQLEMISLLEAMIPRVAEINVGEPTVALNNTIYTFSSLPATFVTEASGRAFSVTPPTSVKSQSQRLLVQVAEKREIASGVVSLDLVPVDGSSLPEWAAGSHIDIFLREDLIRQYSLTGQTAADRYCIGVHLAENSAGGSQAVHELQSGSQIEISSPRNNFALDETADRYVLFSGGIGMTPILAMAWRLHELGKNFTWYVSARNLDRLPWSGEYREWPFSENIKTHLDDDGRRLRPEDIGELSTKSVVYICGPTIYMDLVTGWAVEAGAQAGNVRREHFGAEIDIAGDPFEVVAAKSGISVSVAPDQSIATALASVGVPIQMSCQNGVCGTCLTPVLSGRPEHRDMVLTDSEKAQGNVIAVCCGRSQTAQLVLDV